MKTATAILLAVCLSTACATLPLSATGGHLTPHIAWLALAAGILGALIYCLTSGPAGKPLRMSWADWAASLLFALFALRAFCWLVFYNGDSISVLSPNNLGDLPLHLTFIRFFARGAAFWPQNPIYSGLPLHYPAGIDIFNALLNLAGCDDFRALIWVALVASAVTCYALLRWGGWFAVIGFLCNSGLVGWRFFHHYAFSFQDYQQAVDWKSIPLSMFVTQRGLLYAIPAGILLLAAWRARWFRNPGDPEPAVRIPLWVQVTLYATMPLFHLHTFLFLSALLGWWIILGSKQSPRLREEALDLVLWAILPATACVSLVTGLFQRGQSAAGVVHLKPGWMQDHHEFFRYWFTNFGILPILAIALLVCTILRYRKSPGARNAFAFVFPCLSVFGTACVVMFASWDWDNMKIMIWAYLGILPFLHEMLLAIPPFPGIPVRAACYLMLFFSGFVSLVGGLDGAHTGYEIAKRSELEPVEFAVRFLPPDSTFAGWPTYNHPLLISGCKMVEGYAGHLSSYGINYKARDKELTAMMMGIPAWRDIADALNVRYLYWGGLEEKAYPASALPWKDFPVVAAGDWGTIYDLGPIQPRSKQSPPPPPIPPPPAPTPGIAATPPSLPPSMQ
jgi:hypothetical protein